MAIKRTYLAEHHNTMLHSVNSITIVNKKENFESKIVEGNLYPFLNKIILIALSNLVHFLNPNVTFISLLILKMSIFIY